jgi:hypothetical protein
VAALLTFSFADALARSLDRAGAGAVPAKGAKAPPKTARPAGTPAPAPRPVVAPATVTAGPAAPARPPVPPVDLFHVVAAGESLAAVARKRYGDEKLADLLAAANGLAKTALPAPGKRLLLPHATQHKSGAGDTWSRLAERLCGDARRADLLARANGFAGADATVPLGTLVRVPYPLRRVAGKADTYKSLAVAFYGDAAKADSIRDYNLVPRARKRPRAGEALFIPIFHARVRSDGPSADADAAAADDDGDDPPVTAGTGAAGPDSAPAGTTAAHAPAGDAVATAKPAAAATPASPADALLSRTEHLWRTGEYAAIVALLAAPLSAGTGLAGATPETAGRLRERLAASYGALGDEASAVQAFRDLLASFPDYRPDPVRTSPKILRLLDKARR